MKLHSVSIGNFRVLSNLEIDFSVDSQLTVGENDPRYALSFLVGVNGAGKSTTLRAIAGLFRRLETGAQITDYAFNLEYERIAEGKVQVIKLTNQGSDGQIGELDCQIKDEEGEFNTATFSKERLPLVIAYTTGDESEWDVEFVAPEPPNVNLSSLSNFNQQNLAEMYLREMPNHSVVTDEPEAEETTDRFPKFMLIKSRHLSLVTLCGALSDLANADQGGTERREQAFKAVGMKSLQGFSIQVRLPEDGKESTQQLRNAFARMASVAVHRLRTGNDYRLVFDLSKDEALIAKVVLDSHLEESPQGTTTDALGLFHLLCEAASPSANSPALLRSVELFFEKASGKSTNPSQLLLLSWLSDGEQAFLGRLFLFSLLASQPALILLDEPEVHFNDVWKRRIVQMVDRALRPNSSHIIITTHSSIVLTDASKQQIKVLLKDEFTGKTSLCYSPGVSTLASDPSEIMANVFGADESSGEYSVKVINDALNEATAQFSQYPMQTLSELRELREKVGPGYWSYRIRRHIIDLQNLSPLPNQGETTANT